ncbi:hypothetical protein DFJ77DRAFT_465939 [Powellomyces hirtus]|nr:hypothetical protein DFJ77DRAFT_465939 [Powellomyces hirtus]
MSTLLPQSQNEPELFAVRIERMSALPNSLRALPSTSGKDVWQLPKIIKISADHAISADNHLFPGCLPICDRLENIALSETLLLGTCLTTLLVAKDVKATLLGASTGSHLFVFAVESDTRAAFKDVFSFCEVKALLATDIYHITTLKGSNFDGWTRTKSHLHEAIEARRNTTGFFFPDLSKSSKDQKWQHLENDMLSYSKAYAKMSKGYGTLDFFVDRLTGGLIVNYLESAEVLANLRDPVFQHYDRADHVEWLAVKTKRVQNLLGMDDLKMLLDSVEFESHLQIFLKHNEIAHYHLSVGTTLFGGKSVPVASVHTSYAPSHPSPTWSRVSDHPGYWQFESSSHSILVFFPASLEKVAEGLAIGGRCVFGSVAGLRGQNGSKLIQVTHGVPLRVNTGNGIEDEWVLGVGHLFFFPQLFPIPRDHVLTCHRTQCNCTNPPCSPCLLTPRSTRISRRVIYDPDCQNLNNNADVGAFHLLPNVQQRELQLAHIPHLAMSPDPIIRAQLLSLTPGGVIRQVQQGDLVIKCGATTGWTAGTVQHVDDQLIIIDPLPGGLQVSLAGDCSATWFLIDGGKAWPIGYHFAGYPGGDKAYAIPFVRAFSLLQNLPPFPNFIDFDVDHAKLYV